MVGQTISTLASSSLGSLSTVVDIQLISRNFDSQIPVQECGIINVPMNSLKKTALLFSILAAQSSLATTTFTVTNTLSIGAGSLNEAIVQANAAFGTNTIAFNIPGSGVHTIALTNALPDITQPVIIDGYTQPGASPNTLAIGDNAVILIKIDGGSLNPIIRLCNSSLCGGPGSSDGSTIRGLCFVKAGGGGTMLDIRSHTNLLAGNFIGVDTDGATLDDSGTPVFVGFGTIGNTIGGISPADRNVIASPPGWGLILNDGSSTVVQGNYLGVNAAGTAPLGLGDFAIDVEVGTDCVLGGITPGAGNVINARVTGVQLAAGCLSCTVSATVQGNFIGVDAAGTVPFHTLFRSILVGTCINTLIGGNTPGAANVLSAPGDGILIQGSPTGLVIQGNRIGTDITGTLPVGNGSCGIENLASSTSGTIGGTNAGEGNIIAFNGGNGISIANGNNGWSILGNSIHDNARLGITLVSCGANTPTPNDTCDTDTGGNDHQNYPIITGVALNSGIVTLSGTLKSGTNASYRLEFFGNPSCDPSGFGQGTVFLGATNVTTVNCDTAFTVTFPNAGEYTLFTATATDANGNTSEFSPCALANPRLSIERVPPNAVRLLWPTNPSGFNLEFNTNLATANWQSASPAPIVVGTNNVVTNATTSPQQFYRVKK